MIVNAQLCKLKHYKLSFQYENKTLSVFRSIYLKISFSIYLEIFLFVNISCFWFAFNFKLKWYRRMMIILQ